MPRQCPISTVDQLLPFCFLHIADFLLGERPKVVELLHRNWIGFVRAATPHARARALWRDQRRISPGPVHSIAGPVARKASVHFADNDGGNHPDVEVTISPSTPRPPDRHHGNVYAATTSEAPVLVEVCNSFAEPFSQLEVVTLWVIGRINLAQRGPSKRCRFYPLGRPPRMGREQPLHHNVGDSAC